MNAYVIVTWLSYKLSILYLASFHWQAINTIYRQKTNSPLTKKPIGCWPPNLLRTLFNSCNICVTQYNHRQISMLLLMARFLSDVSTSPTITMMKPGRSVSGMSNIVTDHPSMVKLPVCQWSLLYALCPCISWCKSLWSFTLNCNTWKYLGHGTD